MRKAIRSGLMLVGLLAAQRGARAADYATTVLADNPVGYWRLGERSGTTAFDSVGSHHGTHSGTPIALLDQPGALAGDRDGAPFFTAAKADFVSVPHDASQAPAQLTVETWMTMPGNSSYPGTYASPVLKTSSNLVDGYGFYYYQFALYFFVNNKNINVSFPVPGVAAQRSGDTPKSRFHHLVGTYDGASLSVFMDGQLMATRALNVPLNVPSTPLTIGCGYATNHCWNGKVDEVALYNHPLSLVQIQNHYRVGLGATAISEVQPVAPATSAAYGGKIVVLSPLYPPSSAMQNIASGYAGALSTIANSAFQVLVNPASPPAESIQLIRTQGYTAQGAMETTLLGDLATRGLEAFAALSEPSSKTLKIFSRSETGLIGGMNYYLRMLGYRNLLPGAVPLTPGAVPVEHWKVFPSRGSVRWNVARVEEPDFAFRYFADHGGLATKKNYVPMDPNAALSATWETWKNESMLGLGLGQGYKQVGCAINVAHASEMGDDNSTTPPTIDPHRYRAEASNGAPVPWNASGFYGWHFAYAPFRDNLLVPDRIAALTALVGSDPFIPSTQSIATEACDGTEDNSPESRAFGLPSDNVVTLGNAVANKIASTPALAGRYAGVMAYNTHLMPPSRADVVGAPNLMIAIDPNYFNATGLTENELYAAWRAKVSTVLTYYLAYSDSSTLLPNKVDMFEAGPRAVRSYRDAGLSGFNAEGTHSIVHGFYWNLMGQLAFNTRTLDGPARADMLTTAFGPGKPSMESMLKRWALGSGMNDNELGLSLADIAAALEVTPDATMRSRIYDFAAYLRYLVLLGAYQDTTMLPVGNSVRHDAADQLLDYAWRLYYSGIVESYALAKRVVLNVEAADQSLQDRWRLDVDVAHAKPLGTAYATLVPLSTADFASNFDDDLAASQVLYQPVSFSSQLVPCSTVNPSACPTSGAHVLVSANITQNIRHYVFYAAPGRTQVEFELFVNKPAPGDPRFESDQVPVTVTGPTGAVVLRQNAACFQTTHFTFPTAVAGQYALEVYDSAKWDITVKAYQDTPFALLDGYQNRFGGNLAGRMYFYVPRGTTQFVLTNVAPAAPADPSVQLRIFDANGAQLALTPSGPLTMIAVPAGQDGKIWSLDRLKSSFPFGFDLIPNLLSPSKEQVMVPLGVN